MDTNLEEEFDATYDEMRDVTPVCGDEVLVSIDGSGEVRVGKVIETGTTSSRYEPPQHYFGVQFEDGTENTFIDDDGFLIKRKAAVVERDISERPTVLGDLATVDCGL